jgi:hypothetical protein
MKHVLGDFQMGSTLTDNLLDLAIIKAGDAISSSPEQKAKAIDSITGIIGEGMINNVDKIALALVALAGFTCVFSVAMSALVLKGKK